MELNNSTSEKESLYAFKSVKNINKPFFTPCTQPLTCIEYEDLKDGMLDMINRNSNILPTVVDEFNQQDPLNAPIMVGEVVVGHIIGLIPVVGGTFKNYFRTFWPHE